MPGEQPPPGSARHTQRALGVTARICMAHGFRLDSPSPADQATTVQPQCNGSASHTETAVTDLVATWTGWHANALRQALRMTNEEFAEHLDVSVRTVVYWRTRPQMMPRQSMQQLLDVALQRAPDLAQAQFRRLLAERDGIEPRGAVIASASA